MVSIQFGNWKRYTVHEDYLLKCFWKKKKKKTKICLHGIVTCQGLSSFIGLWHCVISAFLCHLLNHNGMSLLGQNSLLLGNMNETMVVTHFKSYLWLSKAEMISPKCHVLNQRRQFFLHEEIPHFCPKVVVNLFCTNVHPVFGLCTCGLCTSANTLQV